MSTGNYEVDTRTYVQQGTHLPTVVPSWWFYGRGVMGLGAIASGNYPEDSQFTGSSVSMDDRDRSEIYGAARSRAPSGFAIQEVTKTRGTIHANGEYDYRVYVRVKINRGMSAFEVTDKLRSLLSSIGLGTDQFNAVVRSVPARDGGSGGGSGARPGTPAPGATPTSIPADIRNAARCVAVRGVCVDTRSPPSGAGEWKLMRCPDVKDARGRVIIPTRCWVAATGTPAPGTTPSPGRTPGSGSGRTPPSPSGETRDDAVLGGDTGEIDWGKIALWGGVAAIGLVGVFLVARQLKQKRAAKRLREAGAATPHQTVVDFGPAAPTPALAANVRRRRNAGEYSVWYRRSGTRRWTISKGLSLSAAQDLYDELRNAPRVVEISVSKGNREVEYFKQGRA